MKLKDIKKSVETGEREKEIHSLAEIQSNNL